MLGDRQGPARPIRAECAAMNIVYLCADRGIPVLGDKGASVHVREFTTALARAGHEVTLLCATQGKGNPYPPARLIELPPDADPTEIRSEGERLGIGQGEYDQTMRREVDKLSCGRRLAARALDALDAAGVRPDALYERYALFHRSGGDLASALRVPYVLEVNAPLVYEQERFRGLRLKAMAEDAEVTAFQRADHIVAVSEAVREHVLSRQVPVNRVTVLPNGVDIRCFHPQADGQWIRTRHGLDGRPVIGFVGSLKPWHGLDFLLDAFMLVSRQWPEAVLLVVGEGPGSAALQSRATENGLAGKVIMTGRVPHEDIPDYLAAMDLTVAPYLPQDGFYFSPLKVVESLAVGRPVVAPRIGQLPSLIEDGVTGLLFPPGDLAACVGCILTLLNGPSRRQAMGHRAGEAAGGIFGWDKTARQVTEIIAALRSGPM